MQKEIPKIKSCPFCGAEIEPYICVTKDNPDFWGNGLWFWKGKHKLGCPIEATDWCGSFNFGKAEDGEPTEDLIRAINNWNKRPEDYD